MDSLTLTLGVGFEGRAKGVPGNSSLETPLSDAVRTAVTGANKQVYERFRVPLTIGVGATTTLDLTTGLTNPLNEAISGADDFATVLAVLIQHDEASLSATIEAFGGASLNLFQGPWNATAKATLRKGQWVGFGIPANLAGDAVSGTAKDIDLKNIGAAVATVNVIVLGTK